MMTGLLSLLLLPTGACAQNVMEDGWYSVSNQQLDYLVAASTLVLSGTVVASEEGYWFGPSGDEVAEIVTFDVEEAFKGDVTSGRVRLWLEWPKDMEQGERLIVFGGAKYGHLDVIHAPPSFADTPPYDDLIIPLHQNTVWRAGPPRSAAAGWEGIGYACLDEDGSWTTIRTPSGPHRYCSEASEERLSTEVRRLVSLGDALDGWRTPTTVPGQVVP